MIDKYDISEGNVVCLSYLRDSNELFDKTSYVRHPMDWNESCPTIVNHVSLGRTPYRSLIETNHLSGGGYYWLYDHKLL